MEKLVEEKELLLVIADSYCFKIVRSVGTKQVVMHAVTSSIEEILNDKVVYSGVEVKYLTSNYTIVPSALYNESHKESYLNYSLSNEKELDSYMTTSVPSEKVEILWSIDHKIETKIIQKYKGAGFDSLLNSFITNSITQQGLPNKIVSLFLSGVLVFIVVVDGKLQLVNKFEVTSVEDALYYHLLLLQSTGLEEQEVLVQTGGVFAQMDEFMEKLEGYFSEIKRIVDADKNVNGIEKGILEIEKSLR